MTANRAYLKARQEAADAVIIVAVPPPSGSAKLLGVAFPDQPRIDVASAVRNPDAVQTGWTADITGPLPETGTAIRCFAYDAESGQIYPLLGDKRL